MKVEWRDVRVEFDNGRVLALRGVSGTAHEVIFPLGSYGFGANGPLLCGGVSVLVMLDAFLNSDHS